MENQKVLIVVPGATLTECSAIREAIGFALDEAGYSDYDVTGRHPMHLAIEEEIVTYAENNGYDPDAIQQGLRGMADEISNDTDVSEHMNDAIRDMLKKYGYHPQE